jgi:hypothetical protein
VYGPLREGVSSGEKPGEPPGDDAYVGVATLRTRGLYGVCIGGVYEPSPEYGVCGWPGELDRDPGCEDH